MVHSNTFKDQNDHSTVYGMLFFIFLNIVICMNINTLRINKNWYFAFWILLNTISIAVKMVYMKTATIVFVRRENYTLLFNLSKTQIIQILDRTTTIVSHLT